MDSTARQNEILRVLKENNSIKILELSSLLRVSRETIRNDLYLLEKKGLVKKFRGGAILEAAVDETSYNSRLKQNHAAKHDIAKKFVSFIEKGDVVYLDYGTTCLEVAKLLKRHKGLTIITNSIPIINELYKCSGIKLVVLGGEVRGNEGTLYGTEAVMALENYNISIGFISGSGIIETAGLSNHHIAEATLTRAAIKQCQQVFVGVDHSKFGNVFLNKIISIDSIDTLITDKITDQDLVEKIKKKTNLIFAK